MQDSQPSAPMPETLLEHSWLDLIERPTLWREAVVPRLSPRPGLWKCAPFNADTLHQQVRFQCIDSRAVAAIVPSPRAFQAHFGRGPVACFDSLGGDARLVAPAPPGPYAQLWSFLAGAPESTIQALFEAVSQEVGRWVRRTDKPLWLNTHGLGVPWLHVRLDSRPKYYAPGPYRQWP